MSTLVKSSSQSSPRREPRNLASFAPPSQVRWIDHAARYTICSVGLFVILAVALILVFVGKEALPLFYSPTSKAKPELKLPPLGNSARILSWAVDEFQTYSYGLADDGHIYFISNQDGNIHHNLAVETLLVEKPVYVWTAPGSEYILAATGKGKVQIIQVQFKMDYGLNDKQILTPKLKLSPLLEVPWQSGKEASVTINHLTGALNPINNMLQVAVLGENNRLFAGTYDLMLKTVEWKEIATHIRARATGLVIDMDGRFLVLSTDDNQIYRWNLWTSTTEPLQMIQPSSKGSYVTTMELLIGHFTYILGYADGSVEAWFGVRQSSEDTDFKLTKIREFEHHGSGVVKIVPSGVDRGFWTCDDRGNLKMHFNPSARKLYTFTLHQPIDGIAPNNHRNGLSVLTSGGKIHQWELNNPHPDITWKTLFGKVWYEGYEEPNYTWQSSSGSDNFEAKFSLVPLTTGTLKGAFFGLIFAIPLAVLAALYTSQLMHPRVRTFIKPSIEIMAALPSVVIGFLAGLWIAPFLEKHLIAFGLVIPIFLCLVLIAAWTYYQIPQRTRGKTPQEVELGIMLGVVIISMIFSQMLAKPMEELFFHGNIQQWIYDTTGQKVEQRNSLVIGLAMGFAVIPIIFSISEDAMSNVPRHYVSGSLALGATRWQSAVRVVVPTASPGIFSAIMLGFGRAVGETMIVLMATGNTPIMSFSPFNGMRTLSANIAVEIPEAPYGGSLYRILFLGAVLLFLLTFIVNTAAEIIRIRLREKYRAL